MPVSHQRADSSGMALDVAPGRGPSDLSRGGGEQGARARSVDDESLKYLTLEEKDVILFFEETIDSLEDDCEEQALCDGGVHCHSPQSLEGSTSGPSEPEEVIDLVPLGPAAGEPESLPDVPDAAGAAAARKEPGPVLERKTPGAEASLPADGAPRVAPPRPPAPPPGKECSPTPPALAEHPRLPRSVPTPLVLAQKMSGKLAGDEALPPASKDGRPGERRTPTPAGPRSGEPLPGPRHAAQPAPRTPRFPSNISVTNSAARDFTQTISEAAVNVRERTARVLANINGASFHSTGPAAARAPKGELPEPRPRAQAEPSAAQDAVPARAGARTGAQPRAVQPAQQSRGVQTEPIPPLSNGLRSEPGAAAPTGNAAASRPDPAPSSKLARQHASRSLYDGWQPDCGHDAQRRAGSLPRPVGFRPQGVTVQFSGRGSTEEARREALRKLGLLKETS